MRITVLSVGGRELAEHHATPSCNRRDLVAVLVTQLEHVEHSQIRLLTGGGEELRGELTLAESGVRHNSALTLVEAPRVLIATGLETT